jgi:hypothetical protein
LHKFPKVPAHFGETIKYRGYATTAFLNVIWRIGGTPMKWNDLAFWKKLSIAFGALLALLIVSSGVSYTGMMSTLKGAQRTELLNNLNSLFYEKTIDH